MSTNPSILFGFIPDVFMLSPKTVKLQLKKACVGRFQNNYLTNQLVSKVASVHILIRTEVD